MKGSGCCCLIVGGVALNWACKEHHACGCTGVAAQCHFARTRMMMPLGLGVHRCSAESWVRLPEGLLGCPPVDTDSCQLVRKDGTCSGSAAVGHTLDLLLTISVTHNEMTLGDQMPMKTNPSCRSMRRRHGNSPYLDEVQTEATLQNACPATH